MTTGGYTLLQAPRPKQKLVHMHAGAEELGRVYAADLLHAVVDGRVPRRRSRRWPRRPTCRGRDWTRRGARRLRGQPGAGAGRAARHGRGHQDAAAPRARRHGLHQRRRQLQRLAAPLTPLPRPAASRPHAARADLGRDGLRRAGGGRRQPAVSGAHGRQHRRRRRLPDDRPGAGHGACVRRAAGSSAIVVDNGTYGTIRMHQEREYPGSRQSAPTCSTPTSPRWRAPTAGRGARRRRPSSSSRRCARRWPRADRRCCT